MQHDDVATALCYRVALIVVVPHDVGHFCASVEGPELVVAVVLCASLVVLHRDTAVSVEVEQGGAYVDGQRV